MVAKGESKPKVADSSGLPGRSGWSPGHPAGPPHRPGSTDVGGPWPRRVSGAFRGAAGPGPYTPGRLTPMHDPPAPAPGLLMLFAMSPRKGGVDARVYALDRAPYKQKPMLLMYRVRKGVLLELG